MTTFDLGSTLNVKSMSQNVKWLYLVNGASNDQSFIKG